MKNLTLALILSATTFFLCSCEQKKPIQIREATVAGAMTSYRSIPIDTTMGKTANQIASVDLNDEVAGLLLGDTIVVGRQGDDWWFISAKK